MSKLRVAVRTDYSVRLDVTYAEYGLSGAHGATQYQLTLASDPTFAAVKIDTGWDAVDKERRWLTGLPQNTDFIVRARVRNAALAESAWAPTKAFKSRRLFALGGAGGFSSTNEGTAPDIIGQYGSINGSFYTFFTPSGWPELAVPIGGVIGEGLRSSDYGWRGRLYNAVGTYDQTAQHFKQLVRYSDPLVPLNDGLNSRLLYSQEFGMSFAVVFTPYDPEWDFELLGAPAGWVLYVKDEYLACFAADPLVGNRDWVQWLTGPRVRYKEPNVLVGRYAPPQSIYTNLPGEGPKLTLTRSEVCDFWLNGEHVQGLLNRPNPATVPATRYLQWDFPVNCIDVGHGSTNAGAADAYAWGGTIPGVVSEFVYWKDHLIEPADAESLLAASEDPNEQAWPNAVERIGYPRPLILDRYWQPAPPRRPRMRVTL